MAGDDDGDWVAIVGHADSTEGLGFTHRTRYIGIGASLTIRDGEQSAPAGELEVRAPEIERKGEVTARAVEVLFQLAQVGAHDSLRIAKFDLGFFCAKMARIGTNGRLSRQAGVEFQSNQTFIRRRQKKRADRRAENLRV